MILPEIGGTWSGVVVDLALHPEVQYAVIFLGQLLPGRFRTFNQASDHLVAMQTRNETPVIIPGFED